MSDSTHRYEDSDHICRERFADFVGEWTDVYCPRRDEHVVVLSHEKGLNNCPQCGGDLTNAGWSKYNNE